LSVASHPEPLPRDSERRGVIQAYIGNPHWNAFVMAAQSATVFHYPSSLAALEKSDYGAMPRAWGEHHV
jgi:hypothetical protein